MVEDSDFETYLSITPKKFVIYLHNSKNFENLYTQEITCNSLNDSIDLILLSKFLEDNIFKIEKLIGKFIKNIYLIIDTNKSINLKIGIKKKNYDKNLNKKYLENLLTEANDLIKDSYHNHKIIHILISRFLINGNDYPKFVNNINCDHLCLEMEFIFIPEKFLSDIEEVLEKYQIKVVKIFDGKYLENLSKKYDKNVPKLASMIKDGFNENEVKVVPKNSSKMGFFEKFFQLFS